MGNKERRKLKSFKFIIPFNATAKLVLPDAIIENMKVNGKLLKDA
ncbi:MULTISPECIES: hypothetical protein [unclassified Clostridium]|nr:MULTISPECIES: hypothetical protein [unclassified Clostridium]